jgi:hypothetical protein
MKRPPNFIDAQSATTLGVTTPSQPHTPHYIPHMVKGNRSENYQLAFPGRKTRNDNNNNLSIPSESSYSYWLFGMARMFNVEKSQVCYGRIEYLSTLYKLNLVLTRSYGLVIYFQKMSVHICCIQVRSLKQVSIRESNV